MRFFYNLLLCCLTVNGSLGAQTQVLHYDETTGFDHGTRTQSLAFFEDLGTSLGFTVVRDGDGSAFTQANLENFDLVVFSNTSGNSGLSHDQRDALEWFVDVKGGSLLGIHAASDTYRHSTANGSRTGTWDWYAETLGGSVQQSPNHTRNNFPGTIVETEMHPSTANLTFPWEKLEEYYYWENGYLNSAVIGIVLEVTSTGSESYDAQRPVAWTRELDSGAKVFYTSLGHRADNFTGAFPQFEQLLEDAVAWTLRAALPVTLVDFRARANGKLVELHWETASETGSKDFIVERSRNGVTFVTVGSTPALGDSQERQAYSFVDPAPIPGVVYYRLRQRDLNGKETLSTPVAVNLKDATELSVSPNPGTQRLQLRSPVGGVATIYDSAGRVMATATLLADQIQHLNTDTWPAGTYLIQLEDGQHYRWVRR
ncbi:ThuA domain-containing protein [Lewinella sp. 4G2]|uniref:ThuA domain-containing protein n=1 Tax=Lewinella sp. 4G2 TaxID=1803372 RepID=UPI0012F8DAAF|nr:ThuA domain-containing protein [Lewinella sp. 4G2]